MGFLTRLFGAPRPAAPESQAAAAPRAQGETFNGLYDPRFLEFVRGGSSSKNALQVSAFFRCVSLISGAIGMLPLRVMRRPSGSGSGAYEEAADHPLYDVLMYEPNSFQTASEFKQLMESRRITGGNAYAQIVRSRGRVSALLPIDPAGASVRQAPDGSLRYRFTRGGKSFELPAADVFHLRGFSTDGLTGLSMISVAEASIDLSREAAESLRRIYRSGISAGGYLTHPARLSLEAKEGLKQRLEQYSGSANAGRFLVLDEGMKAEKLEMSARDSQTIETARHSVEDIARFFGVPRPLMGVDDTSWGSGVEQLAILFVRFALMQSFIAWEQAIRRALFTREEKRQFAADFDERELLRGSMKDQAEFFAKASGSGGHKPWMTSNEIRDLTGLPRHPDGDSLTPPGAQPAPAPAQSGN